MLDLIRDAISALQTEAASYPSMVRLWMKVMAFSFFTGVVFCVHKGAARGVVLTSLLVIAGLILGKIIFPDISRSIIGAILHIVLWVPLLIWIWGKQPRPSWTHPQDLVSRLYFIWLLWVSVLMSISLVLDILSLV